MRLSSRLDNDDWNYNTNTLTHPFSLHTSCSLHTHFVFTSHFIKILSVRSVHTEWWLIVDLYHSYAPSYMMAAFFNGMYDSPLPSFPFPTSIFINTNSFSLLNKKRNSILPLEKILLVWRMSIIFHSKQSIHNLPHCSLSRL